MTPIASNDPDTENPQELLHPIPPTPPQPYTSRLERSLHRLFLLMLAFSVFGVLFWFYERMNAEVVSQQPIGRFIRMSGSDGLFGRVVIETDLGAYPLRSAPVITKGTPLLLEVRASGDQFVCDLGHSLCIKTVRDKFRAEPIPKASPSSTTSDSLTPSKGATP